MKKDTSTADSKTSKTKTGKATASKAPQKNTKKSVSPEVVQAQAEPVVVEKTNTKAEASSEKPSVKAQEAATASKTAKASPKKTSSKPKAAEKVPVSEAESSSASAEMSVQERVGLTAGEIWQYLSENGPTSVAKLMNALPEKDAIIQRSIGWLARENKVVLSIVDRTETIALED